MNEERITESPSWTDHGAGDEDAGRRSGDVAFEVAWLQQSAAFVASKPVSMRRAAMGLRRRYEALSSSVAPRLLVAAPARCVPFGGSGCLMVVQGGVKEGRA
jgi:hypothetical protein